MPLRFPVWEFKHQWVLVRAVESLRKSGYDVVLTLIGSGAGRPQRLLEKQIAASDPKREFVRERAFVPQKQLLDHLAGADIFAFPSSCENMPNTLLEAMAAGLPLACSNRGSMPEVLEDGGVYFDPESTESIAEALEKIITDPSLRASVARRARQLSEQYSWMRCSEETFAFIADTYRVWTREG